MPYSTKPKLLSPGLTAIKWPLDHTVLPMSWNLLKTGVFKITDSVYDTYQPDGCQLSITRKAKSCKHPWLIFPTSTFYFKSSHYGLFTVHYHSGLDSSKSRSSTNCSNSFPRDYSKKTCHVTCTVIRKMNLLKGTYHNWEKWGGVGNFRSAQFFSLTIPLQGYFFRIQELFSGLLAVYDFFA